MVLQTDRQTKKQTDIQMDGKNWIERTLWQIQELYIFSYIHIYYIYYIHTYIYIYIYKLETWQVNKQKTITSTTTNNKNKPKWSINQWHLIKNLNTQPSTPTPLLKVTSVNFEFWIFWFTVFLLYLIFHYTLWKCNIFFNFFSSDILVHGSFIINLFLMKIVNIQFKNKENMIFEKSVFIEN